MRKLEVYLNILASHEEVAKGKNQNIIILIKKITFFMIFSQMVANLKSKSSQL